MQYTVYCILYAMLCYAMLCYAMLCYAMLCYAMLCYMLYTIYSGVGVDLCVGLVRWWLVEERRGEVWLGMVWRGEVR